MVAKISAGDEIARVDQTSFRLAFCRVLASARGILSAAARVRSIVEFGLDRIGIRAIILSFVRQLARQRRAFLLSVSFAFLSSLRQSLGARAAELREAPIPWLSPVEIPW